MVTEPDRPLEALGPDPHDAAHSTINESGGNLQPNEPSDDQSSDPGSSTGDSIDVIQLSFKHLLSLLASPPDRDVEADLKMLWKMIEIDNSQVNVQDDSTKLAPLHIAARHGVVDAVEELLEAGAKLGVQDREGSTPLMTATENEHVEIMAKLLTPRSDSDDTVESQLEVRDILGRTPLLWASINGFLKGVKLLIAKGANRNARTCESKSTPLIAASSWGYKHVVKALLDDSSNPRSCAKLDIPDTGGNTALHVAVSGEHLEIAQLLVDAKADLKIKDKNGQRPLHLASEQGNKSIVNLLLDLDSMEATVNESDQDQRTPLHLAINTLHKLQSKLPFDQSDSIELTMEEESNAELQSAKCIDTIQLLLDRGARPEALTREGDTALHLVVGCGEPSIIKGVMEKMKPEDLWLCNQKGETVLSSILHFKGQRRAIAMRAFLESELVKVADFDQRDAWKGALEWAANDHRLHDIAQLLLCKRPGNGENPPPNSEKWSAISWAAHEQLPEVLLPLMSTSPGTMNTAKALKSALTSTLRLVKGLRVGSREASDQLPLVLWLLITASPKTESLQAEFKETLQAVEILQGQRQSLPPAAKPRGVDRKDISKAVTNNSSFQRHDNDRYQDSSVDGRGHGNKQAQSDQKPLGPEGLETIKDILRDPPFARVHQEPTDYSLLQPEEDLHDVLDNFQANVVQFFKAGGVSKTVQATRKVHEIIYQAGPRRIMQTGTAMQKAVASLHSDVGEIDLDFTWVHLPATNMVWMNDLLTRILKDEDCSARRYYETRSFFQDSWVEVPDGISESRIMRPRTVSTKLETPLDLNMILNRWDKTVSKSRQGMITREYESTKEGKKIERKAANEENGNIEVPPELQARGKRSQATPVVPLKPKERKETDAKEIDYENGKVTEKLEEGNRNERRDMKRAVLPLPEMIRRKEGSDFVAVSAIYMPYLCYSFNLDNDEDRFPIARARYAELVAAYPITSAVHGSPTLDEWYYHFQKDDETSDKDRLHRNMNQVVTKYQRRRKLREKNGHKNGGFIWIWIIGNKWLITANSFMFGEDDGMLVQQILDQLSKRAEYGGRKSQPGSAVEMGRFIVEHCAGSYDRRPESARQSAPDAAPSDNQKKPWVEEELSISQIYSNYMSEIGRDETALFEAFQNWTKQNALRGRIIHPRSDLSRQASLQYSTGAPVDAPIEVAIQYAYTLSSDIKDVLDELNILKSVAQYQQIVQRGMTHFSVKDGDLSASYVVKNIREMDIVANRIQTAINMTLSLQQSEIANRSAIESVQQGKFLMVFTFATLLFLPLSFLSSLFALDVSSFLQTPDWAFVVLFLVSIAVSIAVLLIVFHKEGIKFVVDVWNKLFPRSFKSEPTPELRRVFRHRLSDEHSMC